MKNDNFLHLKRSAAIGENPAEVFIEKVISFLWLLDFVDYGGA